MADNPNLPLQPPHAEILAKVMNVSTSAVWDHLLSFLMWGKPDRNNSEAWIFYHCWQALRLTIQEAQEHSYDYRHQRRNNQTIAAAALGWDEKKVIEHNEHYLNRSPSFNALLAGCVLETITELQNWEQRYIQEMLTDLPADAIQPGTWVWLLERHLPVIVAEVHRNTYPDNLTGGFWYKVLVPRTDSQNNPTFVNSTVNCIYFDIANVDEKQLARIQPSIDELQY